MSLHPFAATGSRIDKRIETDQSPIKSVSILYGYGIMARCCYLIVGHGVIMYAVCTKEVFQRLL